MKAVICREAELAVVERPDPRPGPGQVLIDVSHCGICGSDLHARRHARELAEMGGAIGYDAMMRPEEEIVFGHEFCGEVVERGPGCRRAGTGVPVVALPMLRGGGEVHPIGFSVHAPGAYAEQMVIEESLSVPVPNGLPLEVATMTEPMAVGYHAVRRGEVGKRQVAIVIGCGPVGLAVITMLKATGVRVVIASDFSAARRDLARRMGADVVVDPAAESPYAAAGDRGWLTVTGAFELVVGTMERLEKVPIPTWGVWRAVERLGIKPKSPVIFECVGVPGMIDDVVLHAPFAARAVVVGVCMEADRFRPALALNKELDLRFAFGYTPLEFRDTLHMIAEGKVDPRPLVTGTVGLAGVDGAFAALGDAETHAKILVDPRSDAAVAPAT